MAVFDEDLDSTARAIWESMFGLPLTPVAAADNDAETGVTGIVVLEGEFEGALLVRCGLELAQRLTGMMFGQQGTPPVADVSDAVGELANMLAGNVKAVLPGPCSLGLPVVAFGSDYELSMSGSRIAGEVGYSSDGGYVRITLLEHAPDAEESI